MVRVGDLCVSFFYPHTQSGYFVAVRHLLIMVLSSILLEEADYSHFALLNGNLTFMRKCSRPLWCFGRITLFVYFWACIGEKHGSPSLENCRLSCHGLDH